MSDLNSFGRPALHLELKGLLEEATAASALWVIRSCSLSVRSRVLVLAVPEAVLSPPLSTSSSESVSCKLNLLTIEGLLRRRLGLEFGDDADAEVGAEVRR